MLKQIMQYVNEPPFLFFFGKVLFEDASDPSGIHFFFEGNAHTRKKHGVGVETDIAKILGFFENPVRMHVLVEMELIFDAYAFRGEGKFDSFGIFLEEQISNNANENKSDGNDGIIGKDGVENESAQEECYRGIPQGTFFFFFVLVGFPDENIM